MPRQAFDFRPQTQDERDIYELYNMVAPNSKDHWDLMPDELMMELSCRGMHSGEFLGLTFNAPPYVYRLILVPTFIIKDGRFDLKLTWEELTEDVPKFSGASDAIRRHVAYCTYEDRPHLFKGEQTLGHFKRRITILLVKTEDKRSYVLKDPNCLDWLVRNRPAPPQVAAAAQGLGITQERFKEDWTRPPAPEQRFTDLDMKTALEQIQAVAKARKLIIKITPKDISVHKIVQSTEKVALEQL